MKKRSAAIIKHHDFREIASTQNYDRKDIKHQCPDTRDKLTVYIS